MSLLFETAVKDGVIDESIQRKPDQYSVWKETLFTRLLDAIKQCQSHFGRQKLVAGDDDARVGCLLAQLEAVLCHGLIKQDSVLSGALRSASLLMSDRRNKKQPDATFWPILRHVLPEGEIVRLLKLQRISSDGGRVRSWIRMALNERSIGRHIQSVIDDHHRLLAEYYEHYAFIRDQEMAERLPQICQGLSTIMFSLNTDMERLDSWDDVGVECTEMLLEARQAPQPMMALNHNNNRSQSPATSRNKSKPRRKPLVNVVKFGDAATEKKLSDTMGKMQVRPKQPSVKRQDSGSKASTRSSRASSVNDQLDRDGQDQSDMVPDPSHLQTISSLQSSTENGGPWLDMEAGMGGMPALILNAGNHDSSTTDQYCPSPPGSCSSHSDVLTSANGGGAQTAEVASLTAQLDVCYKRIAEQRTAYEQKLNSAQQESELLRRQLKSYADNVRQLESQLAAATSKLEADQSGNRHANGKTDEVFGDDEEDGDGDNQESSDIQRQYEHKMLQMATMHAELVEFNDHLVKSLNRRRHHVHRLRNELVMLRGPMPTDNAESDSESPSATTTSSSMSSSTRPTVNICIPTAFLSGKKTDVYHLYQVYFRVSGGEWNIYRRYSQFRQFHLQMTKVDEKFNEFEFPPKKTVGKKKKEFVEDRRKLLEAYMRRAVNHVVQTYPEFTSVPVNKDTICRIITFIKLVNYSFQ